MASSSSLLFTQQQLSGGPSYNCSTLIGNWYEDVQYQENRSRFYNGQKASGSLLSQKIRAKLLFHNQPTVLTPQHEDGYLHFGDQVMLQCADTSGFVSLDLDDSMKICGHGTKYILTSALSERPKLRNTLVITSIPTPDDSVYPPEEVEIIHYGQPFAIMFHREIVCTESKKTLFMHSEPSSGSGVYSKISRNQEVVGVCEGTYDLVWKCEYLDQDLRMEMEGQPVLANTALILNHCATNQPLCSNAAVGYLNDFGREFELCCVSNRGTGTKKRCLPELPSNHWAFITGPPTEGSAKLPEDGIPEKTTEKEPEVVRPSSIAYQELPNIARKVIEFLRQQLLVPTKSKLNTITNDQSSSRTPASAPAASIASRNSKTGANAGNESTKSTCVGNPIRNLIHALQAIDNNGSRPLDRYELENALLLCAVKATRQELDLIMNVLARDSAGLTSKRVYASDFMHVIRESILSSASFSDGRVDFDRRRELIKLAFEKLAGESTNVISFSQLLNSYNYAQHPDIEDEIKQPIPSKRKTAEQFLQDFLVDWGFRDLDEVELRGNRQVSFREFSDYYNDVSLTIPDDSHFELIMQQTWLS